MTTDRPPVTGALCCYALATLCFAALAAGGAVAGGLAPLLVALVTVVGSSLGVLLTAFVVVAARPAAVHSVRPALHLVDPYPRPRQSVERGEVSNRRVHSA